MRKALIMLMLFTACQSAWAAASVDLAMVERKINLAQAKGEVSTREIIVLKKQVQVLKEKAKAHIKVDQEVAKLNDQVDKTTKRHETSAVRPRMFGIF